MYEVIKHNFALSPHIRRALINSFVREVRFHSAGLTDCLRPYYVFIFNKQS